MQSSSSSPTQQKLLPTPLTQGQMSLLSGEVGGRGKKSLFLVPFLFVEAGSLSLAETSSSNVALLILEFGILVPPFRVLKALTP